VRNPQSTAIGADLMCGLYASVGFQPEQDRIQVVAHRGPDGSGWQTFHSNAGPIAIGHRRLAIIDTSGAGIQPMVYQADRYHLVFNGEIYNYLELREELKALGHTFSTQSDSEVLLAAFAEWDRACLNRLIGMFAFVIWDNVAHRMFVARDRFGIKPLYVFAGKEGIAFASEIKQLLGLRGQTGRMNLARVHDFLAFGLSDHSSETMFEGIAQLQPGCFITIDATCAWNGSYQSNRWYAIPEPVNLDLSEEDAAAYFQELLTTSVRMHLRSDVPVGSCLSGGLDSSSIVCLMADLLRAEHEKARTHTVSACFEVKAVDERRFMDAVVSQTDALPHYTFPSADDVLQSAQEITWHQDEPFGSTSIFSQWCVFKEAKRCGIKVMLDGQGADEQLAGYHSAFRYHAAGLVRRGQLLQLVRTIAERQRAHGVSAVVQLIHLLGTLAPKAVRRYTTMHRASRGHSGWLNSEALAGFDWCQDGISIASLSNGLPQATDISTLCLVQTFASNLQMLLHWEDRNSMAHSIEARVPFLDHRLVEFSLALGNHHKIVGADTKRVLRQAMAGVLPGIVRERRDKIGFATPEETWFRGPLKGAIVEGVESTLKRFPQLLNVEGTRQHVARMLNGQTTMDFSLWRIVNVGIWGERFRVTL
jgi:asparagine synthase (glutamine-hydrolysing)